MKAKLVKLDITKEENIPLQIIQNFTKKPRYNKKKNWSKTPSKNKKSGHIGKSKVECWKCKKFVTMLMNAKLRIQ